MKGTVKFFDGTKGWGFITDENKNDVFVHYSNITMEGRKSLDENDIVDFEIGEGKDGRSQAVNVKRISNDKKYDDMTQAELTKEFVNIIKQNYENGICLLDSNYELIQFDQILEKDIIKIDDAISIVRNLKRMPNFKEYCKGMAQ
ncbi:cold-shock protein [Lachnospira eligens]|jgi:CspA family cold shock protein|uniref:Cold shock domain-containing protein n=1 Tax=Lachnospira eligens TaxID=39485 RepID=A0A414DGS5_9FIRM|nr:cold shock domain-containing protein [Lachnospira eligens]RHK49384.1 cold shock domain-containing protein [Lachnospira eligens]RHK82930.1 cold shock domain-containing protein [Lachnospira eligens]